MTGTELTTQDQHFLQQCVDLAQQALDAGDEPFGSVLVAADGVELFADRNRVSGGDHTRHPEFEIARWAASHLTAEQRLTATVYTSGEHCPMCAAAHAWVGLGPIVYASSAAQLTQWFQEWNIPPAPVAPLPVTTVAPQVVVRGPYPEYSDAVRALQAQFHGITGI
ncbi:MAG TPA: nucleoside deaminase [Enteractinococcus sp.]